MAVYKTVVTALDLGLVESLVGFFDGSVTFFHSLAGEIRRYGDSEIPSGGASRL
jgi:hypothetical protein